MAGAHDVLVAAPRRVAKHPTSEPTERAEDVLVLTAEPRLGVRVAEVVQHRNVLTVGKPHLA
jgi:hypothetical protein